MCQIPPVQSQDTSPTTRGSCTMGSRTKQFQRSSKLTSDSVKSCGISWYLLITNHCHPSTDESGSTLWKTLQRSTESYKDTEYILCGGLQCPSPRLPWGHHRQLTQMDLTTRLGLQYAVNEPMPGIYLLDVNVTISIYVTALKMTTHGTCGSKVSSSHHNTVLLEAQFIFTSETSSIMLCYAIKLGRGRVAEEWASPDHQHRKNAHHYNLQASVWLLPHFIVRIQAKASTLV